jgi:hypothetical protein
MDEQKEAVDFVASKKWNCLAGTLFYAPLENIPVFTLQDVAQMYELPEAEWLTTMKRSLKFGHYRVELPVKRETGEAVLYEAHIRGRKHVRKNR